MWSHKVLLLLLSTLALRCRGGDENPRHGDAAWPLLLPNGIAAASSGVPVQGNNLAAIAHVAARVWGAGALLYGARAGRLVGTVDDLLSRAGASSSSSAADGGGATRGRDPAARFIRNGTAFHVVRRGLAFQWPTDLDGSGRWLGAATTGRSVPQPSFRSRRCRKWSYIRLESWNRSSLMSGIDHSRPF